MNSKRKILSAFLSFSLLLASFGTFGLSAATVTEREDNNSTDTANPISINDTVIGNLSSYNDVDYYKISVSERGYFSFGFSHDLMTINESDYWDITVYRVSDTLEEVYNGAFNVNKRNSSSPKIGVLAGTYYVELKYGSGGLTKGVEYRLTANFTATDFWENESNGSYSSADEISLNSVSGGFIEDYNDIDLYKFSTPQNGYIEIKFDHDLISTDEYSKWRIKVYKETDTLDEIFNGAFFVNKKSATGPKIGLEAGTYYIKIGRNWDDYPYVDEVEYRFSADFTATNYWESENNDDHASADTISANSVYSGFIESDSDNDFYKISFEKDGEIQIKFEHSLVSNDNNSRWGMTVYRETDTIQEIYREDFYVNKQSALTSKIGVSSGIYYIKLNRYWVDNTSVDGVTYNLSVLTGEQPPVSDGAGDINGDKAVNSKDLTRMMKYIAGEIVELLSDADINGDGIVNSKDLTRLMKIIAGVLM